MKLVAPVTSVLDAHACQIRSSPARSEAVECRRQNVAQKTSHPCDAAARAQQTHGPGTQACAPECAEAASLSTRAGRAFHADTVACTIQSVKLTGHTRLPDMIAARSLRGRGAQETKCRSENVTLAMRPRALSKFPRSRHTSIAEHAEYAEEASLSTRSE